MHTWPTQVMVNLIGKRFSEAPPQTDEACCRVERSAVSLGPGLEPLLGDMKMGEERWTPVEPSGACPECRSVKLDGSEDPWTTGARDDHSTIGG